MKDLILSPTAELVVASGVPQILTQVRPVWQAKDLINRVKKLLPVDPSSACQRLFNAGIHDLREKIVIAGVDIAADAAKQFKLPPVNNPEDIEHYQTSKIIDLSYRMGLLSRPEWRRVSRCYEIRRDLEHEDDEYEAGVEDCVYIFETCVNVILAKDPIHLIRVTDVKELVEEPQPAVPAESLLTDYEHAPQPRQEEILKFLTAVAIDEEQAELVRQNAFTFLKHFSDITQNQVKLTLAGHLQEKITRKGPSRLLIRIAVAAGVLPYLKKNHLKDFFSSVFQQREKVGHNWGAFSSHGELLRSFKDIGGLVHCPAEERKEILKWLVLAYIGVPGGRTSYGNIRHVFYSNTAAPLVEELISESSDIIRSELHKLQKDKNIKRAIENEHIQRRVDHLLDLVEEDIGNG